jgi:LacI family transcriptional regulator
VALTGRQSTTRVSAETAEMIRKVAGELGYQPNPLAQGLVTRQTGVLALALPYAAAFWDGNPFNQAVIRGAAEAAAQQGYNLILETHRNHAWQEWDAAAVMDPRAEGALVVAPAVGSPLLSAIAEADYPAVAAVCDPHDCPLPSVNAADADGACNAVNTLLHLGHRRIGYLMGPEEIAPNRERREGFRRALEGAGIDPRESPIVRTTPEDQGGFRAAVGVLARPSRPTALLACNDLVARGAIEAARQMGLEVPAQLSVIGFDDADFAATMDPPLTTVRYPAGEIAARALELLIHTIRGGRPAPREAAPPLRLLLPTHLVERASCAPPAPDSAA